MAMTYSQEDDDDDLSERRASQEVSWELIRRFLHVYRMKYCWNLTSFPQCWSQIFIYFAHRATLNVRAFLKQSCTFFFLLWFLPWFCDNKIKIVSGIIIYLALLRVFSCEFTALSIKFEIFCFLILWNLMLVLYRKTIYAVAHAVNHGRQITDHA